MLYPFYLILDGLSKLLLGGFPIDLDLRYWKFS